MNRQKDNNGFKILHIITVFSIGGATENTLLTARGFIKKGYKVDILTGPNVSSEGDMYELGKRFGVNVITLSSLKRKIDGFSDIISLFKIFRFIRKNGYNLVHTHSSKAGIIGRLAAKMARTPIVIHTIHGLPFHDYQNYFLNRLYVLIEKIGSHLSDKIITVTEKIVSDSLKKGISSKDKYKVVRSGFDLSSFSQDNFNCSEIRNKLGISSEDIVIGKIARFSELKGHKYLLEAVPKIISTNSNIKILLVGSGELENQIKDIVNSLNLQKNIIFTGLIEYEKIPEIISVLDILVHTSLLEGLARVIPQAYLLKKPVVSFDIDGASEVVLNNETGFLVEPKNSEQLAEAIITLSKDRKLRENFGENGYNLVRENWSQEKMVNDLELIYNQLRNNTATNYKSNRPY
jgi:glycosyltransferase involved in cell wall biosynthesis